MFVFQNSNPGGVGVRFLKTLSQIRVSRDLIFINIWCKMLICANSLMNSCKSGISTEAHSLRSDQLPDHFPLSLLIEADLYPFKTQALEHLRPRFVEHLHKSELPEQCFLHMSSFCQKRSADSYILGLCMSQISLGQIWSPSIIVHHPSSINHHLSSITYHLTRVARHISPITSHSSSIT